MSRVPIRKGVFLAAAAAVLFGATTPFLQQASRDAGALAAAGLLYLGAGLASLGGSARSRRDAPLVRADVPRLLTMAVLGAVFAPAALVLGLARTDAASASLLLALEAPFTLVLARIAYGEHLGRRVIAAVGLVFVGVAILGGGRLDSGASLRGGALVVLATALWALDNTLSRKLADRDPVAVVAGKGLVGGGAAVAVSLLTGERLHSLASALALVGMGAVGYGLSLQLYLRAQRVVGAARTASVFATAPFAGALVALGLGARGGWPLVLAAASILAGVWLHASERHRHLHSHEAIEHEHAHVHDDGHHGHRHEPPILGAHSHLHRHDPIEHDHEHGEDLHHLHAH